MTDRLLTIVCLVALLAVAGLLGYRAYIKDARVEVTAAPVIVEDVPLARRTSAWAKLTECNKDRVRIEAKGYIENTGNVDLRFVTVKVIWSNSYGLVVEENQFYALNDEVLAPGEKRSFTDVTDRSTVTQCNVEPVDWW